MKVELFLYERHKVTERERERERNRRRETIVMFMNSKWPKTYVTHIQEKMQIKWKKFTFLTNLFSRFPSCFPVYMWNGVENEQNWHDNIHTIVQFGFLFSSRLKIFHAYLCNCHECNNLNQIPNKWWLDWFRWNSFKLWTYSNPKNNIWFIALHWNKTLILRISIFRDG